MYETPVLIICTESETNTHYKKQLELLSETTFEGVVFIIVQDRYVKINGAVKPHLPAMPFYDDLAIALNQFTVLLFDKAGNVALKSSQSASLKNIARN